MLKPNPEIFKAYDIRGIYGVDLDEETAYRLGRAYCEMRKAELADKKEITVVAGKDMRLSSEALSKKLIEGLLDGGFNVVDIGLVSTPTFYFAVAHYGYDGGIIVSASHNPKEWNGFKLVREKALPISKDSGIFSLRDLVVSEKTFEETAKKGLLSQKEAVVEAMTEEQIALAQPAELKTPLKVVIDPANSMGATYFEALSKKLNWDLVRMNWDLDGTFPNHEADPLKEENMLDLCSKVKEVGADLGISTDGDGDRIFFVDNQGETIEPGIIRAILSKIFLKENPGATIAYDIRPGRITLDTILSQGGRPVVTPVGHSLIKAIAIKEKAVFAGESSGHFFINMKEGCYEVPLIITMKLINEVLGSGKTFSEYIQPYKKYFPSGEINSTVENVTAKIAEIKEKFSNGEQNELDGITVEYPDWWFNVRGSNTEPKIRLNLEARTKGKMTEGVKEVLGVIRG